MTMECPRCMGGVLEEIEIDSVLIDRCRVCAGLWFDQGEIAQMVGPGSEISELESRISDEESSMNCPRCIDVKLRLTRMCSSDAGNFEVYRCASCMGTWIDRGGLNHLEDKSIAGNTKALFRECLNSG